MIIEEFILSPSLLFDRAATSGDTHYLPPVANKS
jgi:hypothetical protein